jgi:hypothetical protein
MKHYQFTALALILALGVSASAFAEESVWSQVKDGQTVTGEGTDASGEAGQQTATDEKDHPLVNYLDQRDLDQQNRIDEGVAKGTLTSAEAATDQAALTHKESVQDAQEANHNGHLTLGELAHDNHALNRSSNVIATQKGVNRVLK